MVQDQRQAEGILMVEILCGKEYDIKTKDTDLGSNEQ